MNRKRERYISAIVSKTFKIDHLKTLVCKGKECDAIIAQINQLEEEINVISKKIDVIDREGELK